MMLTDFLLARIAEDEAVAQATMAHFDPLDWGEPGKDDEAYRMAGPVDGPSGYGALIVDPKRVLRDCEAKRRIVDEWRAARAQADDGDLSGQVAALAFSICLKSLALSYAGHPDYDEAWRM